MQIKASNQKVKRVVEYERAGTISKGKNIMSAEDLLAEAIPDVKIVSRKEHPKPGW